MFVNDRPIQDKKDDKLSRSNFSIKLAKSIIDWKDQDSLVIALYGKWGSGKSSVINLVKKEIKDASEGNKLRLLEFNPWFFSGEEKINEHFFNELAKELEIRNASARDVELANKFRAYAKLFGLIPEKDTFDKLIERALIILGFFGISSGQILQWLHIDIGRIKVLLFIAGTVFLILSLFSKVVESIADFFEKRAEANDRSVLSFKNEIKDFLLREGGKILILIDDIDRLTPEEIRLIFKLIKINTDFPNIIFLLSFDREIVQEALALQPGVNGQDYIDKIVQVSFDIPFVKQEKINEILFEELDRILGSLPKGQEALFDQIYWGNVFHGGLKDFFRNIRDVKRFASSLEFNFSLMLKEQSIEVNPVDLIAIEAIRIFAPQFYKFIKSQNSLFTSTERERSAGANDTRKKEIEDELDKLPDNLKESVKELIRKLFPQIDGVLQYGYSSYGPDWLPNWNRSLRACSPKFFDVYFTLIPGGDEKELSQFEVDLVLDAVNDSGELEAKLREVLENGKFKKLLERLEDYTSDKAKLPDGTIPNVILSLFNISDDLPDDRGGMFGFSSDLLTARIIYQLLKRDLNREANFTIFKDAIEKSKGLYGPIYNIALESQKEEKQREEQMLIAKDKLPSLHEILLNKITEYKNAGTLQSNKNLLSILYRWKEWSTGTDWKDYVTELTSTDEGLVEFLKLFVYKSSSHTIGDYVSRIKERFGYEGLANFVSSEEVKTRVETIKYSDQTLYQGNKKLVDLFLDNSGKKSDFFED